VTTVNELVALGATLVVDASALTTAASTLAWDGSAELDGNFDITGSANADTIIGGLGDDSITAGAGADSLIGGDGNDVFVYSLNSDLADGESINGGSGTDAIRLDAGGTYDFTMAGTVVSNIESVIVNSNSSFSIALSDDFNSNNGNVEISNGMNTAITQAVRIDASAFTGGSAALKIISDNFNGDDEITGGAGNDTIYGGDGDDVLTGNAGADSIVGGAGNDVISGGVGNDTLVGGVGADTINVGSGSDTVGVGTVEADGIDFVSGLTADDLLAFHDSTHYMVMSSTVTGIDLNAALQTVSAAAKSASGGVSSSADWAVGFVYGGNKYVYIDGTTDGYSAADDAVVRLYNATDLSALTATTFIV
jgi:Ca2+-binding RTX toxin-like protein